MKLNWQNFLFAHRETRSNGQLRIKLRQYEPLLALVQLHAIQSAQLAVQSEHAEPAAERCDQQQPEHRKQRPPEQRAQ